MSVTAGEASSTTEARDRPASLWRNADFIKFWAGMNVSFLGAQVSMLAYPLIAVITLQATPSQMGWLRATGSAAAVIAGPFAGVLADRLRRRPVLIATDLGAALLALSIPLAAASGVLSFGHLYVVQFLSGALFICADITLMSYLPTLVRREQLVEANSKIQASSSAISLAGPGLAGVLIQLLTAPFAIIFDAASFMLSALSLWRIRAPEPELARAAGRGSVRAEIAEGLRVVYDHRLLRPLAEGIALHFLFAGMIYSIFILYAVRQLSLSPASLGLVMAALGPGFLTGALLAPRAAARFGAGRVLVWSTLLTAAGMSLIPLAGGSTKAVVVVLAASHLLSACGIQLHGITLVSLRQSVTPHRLQGRMNASFRFVNLFAGGIGALAAGYLGETVGLRATLAVGAGGLVFPFLRLLLSPVRSLREVPVGESA